MDLPVRLHRADLAPVAVQRPGTRRPVVDQIGEQLVAQVVEAEWRPSTPAACASASSRSRTGCVVMTKTSVATVDVAGSSIGHPPPGHRF